MRRVLALLLLLAHGSAAAHLALAAHAVGDGGAVVEAQPECTEVSGHGSDGIAHGHELLREELECDAVALLRAPAKVTAAPLALHVAAAPVALELAHAEASPPLAVLSVAPKSSPPV